MKYIWKRATAILLAVVICFSTWTASTFAVEVDSADEADAIVTVGTGVMNGLGTTVDVPVTIAFKDENVKVDAFGLAFRFDTDAFVMHTSTSKRDPVVVTAGTLCEGETITANTTDSTVACAIAGGYYVDQALINDYQTNILFYLRFDAVEGYFNGIYPIDVDVIDGAIGNFAYLSQNVNVYFEPGSLTMSGGIDTTDLTPTFSTQPVGATYSYGDTAAALTVEADVTTAGTLTYQWYKNGAAISGAAAASYTPELSDYGTNEYYCVVTNTYSGRTFTATSDTAKIIYQKAAVATLDVAIAAPVKNGVPQTEIAANGYINTGTIQWQVDGTAFSGSAFLGGTAYTANVKLTLADTANYDFSNAVVSVDGATSVSDVTFTQENKILFSATFPATEDRELASIAITENPEKTNYIDGETFDPAGMVVTATYDDGTSGVVEGYTYANTALTTGQTAVTVTYGGKETTVPVTVEPNTLVSIAVSGNFKKNYTVNDAHDWKGMVVTATYKRGNKADVTSEAWFSGFDSTKYAESQTITVSYTENGVTEKDTFTITVERITNAADNFVVNKPQNAVYSGAAYEVTVTAKDTAADYGTVTVYYDGKTEAPKDAGTYAVTYSVEASDTHSALENVSAGNLVIAPKAVTVEVEKATATYGEAIPAFTAKLAEGSAVADGETVAGLGLTLTTDAVQGSDVGSYDVTGTASNKNYAVTIDGSKAFEITKRDVTISGVGAADKTYDGTAAAAVTGTAQVVGKYGDDEVTVVPGTAAFANKDAADGITVTFSGFSLTGAKAGNYNLVGQPDSVTAAISPKELTVVWSHLNDLVYDGTAKLPTAAVNTGIEGETVALTVNPADENGYVNAGEGYGVTATMKTANTNYTLTNTSARFNILKRTVTITGATVADKTYDGTTDATVTGVTFDNVVTGESLENQYSATAVFASEDAAEAVNAAVTVTIGHPNYQLAEGTNTCTATAKISPYEITSGALSDGTVAVTKTYDGTDAAGTVTGKLAVAGLGEETLFLTVAAAGAYEESAVNVGTGKTVVLTLGELEDGTGKAANYKPAADLTYTFTGAVITPADYSYTVTAQQSVKEGGGLSQLTHPAQGTGVNSETVAGSFGWYTNAACTAAAADSDLNGLSVGAEKTLYWKFTATNSNYTAEAKTGSITAAIVSGDPQTPVFDNDTVNKTYGDEKFTNGVVIRSGDTAIDGHGTVTYTSSDTTVATVDSATGEVTILKPGTTTITANVARVDGVYAAGSASYTLSVEKKTLTGIDVNGITVTKVYDGTAAAGTLSGTVVFFGKVGSDDVSIAAAAGAYADKNVGSDKAVTLTLTLTGAKADYYQLSSSAADITASITASAAVTDATAKNQNVVVGVGSFAQPKFTGVGGEAVTGTVTYTFDNATTSYDDIVLALKALAKNATATIKYSFAANGNYTGTYTGSIAVTMVDIVFTAGDAVASSANAITVKKDNPTYGDSWNDVLELKDMKASLDGSDIPGTFTIRNADAIPNAGQQTYTVVFSANDANRYQNVQVFTGTVTFAKKSVAAVWSNTALTYNGREQKPTAAVTEGLVGSDTLTVSVSGAKTDAGTYNATASITDTNYTLTNETATYTIAPKSVAVEWSNTALTYNGSEQAPIATVDTEIAGVTLTPVVSGGETNVGSYTATASTDNGNFTLTNTTVNYAINPKTVNVTVNDIDAQTFDGSAKEPAVTLTVDGLVGEYQLVKGIDYTVSYRGNTNAGTATVTVTAMDGSNYTFADATQTFTIEKQGVDIPTANTGLEYNGSAQTGVTLPEGAKYTLSGNVQTNAGGYTAVATLTDSANYKWNGVGENESAPQNIAWSIDRKTVDRDPSAVTGLEYTGSEQTGVAAINGQYTVTDGEKTDAGDYTATAVLNSNYKWTDGTTVDKRVEWSIVQAEVEVPDTNVTFTYDGSEKTAVTGGAHYTISGDNTATDVGSYTVTLTLESTNYKWATAFDGSITWTVTKAAARTDLTGSASVRYDNREAQIIGKDTFLADAKDVVITNVSEDSDLLTAGVDDNGNLKFTLADSVVKGNVGQTADITVTFNSKNYADGSKTVITVTVTDKINMGVGAEGGNKIAYTGENTLTYNGFAQTPSFALASGFAAGTNGSWKYEYKLDGNTVTEMKNAGTYTVTASYEDDTYFGKSEPVTITVNPAPLAIVANSAAVTAKKYDGSTDAAITTVEFSGLKGSDTLALGTDFTVTGAFADKNAGRDKTVTVTVTLGSTTAAKNYTLSGTGTSIGTIQAKEITVTVNDIADQTFDGSAKEPVATLSVTGLVGEDQLVKDTDYTVTYRGNTNVGTATVTVTAKDGSNYTFQAVKEFTINKASAPTLSVDGTVDFKYTVTGDKTVTIQGVPANAGTASWSVGDVTDASGVLNGTPTVSDGVVSFVLNGLQAYSEGITATIPVTVVMDNYADATVNVVIRIKDRDVPVVSAEDLTVSYTGVELTDAAIKGTSDVAGSWSWVTDMATLVNAGTYSATAKFSPEDTVNYTEVTVEVTVTVNKVKVTVPSAVNGLIYNAAEQTGVVDGEHYSVTGNTATNAGNYTATVTLDDSANYEWASAFEGTVQWSVAKANLTGTPGFTKINSAGKTLADVAVDLTGMNPSAGTFKWVDADGNELESTTKVEANKAYKWVFTPDDTANYNAVSNTVVLYVYHVYIPSAPSTSTETTKNEDGSVTTTVTDKKTGTVTETTENVDGSTTVVETKKDGTVTETNTTAEGVTGTTVTDAQGNVTEVVTEIPAEAVEAGETVTVPVEVSAAASSEEAVEVTVTVPETVEKVNVEIPVAAVTPGSVVVIVHEDGTEEVVKKTSLTENGLVVKLEGSVTVKIVENSKTFVDVDPDIWYADGVDFASSRELYNGVGNDRFDPDGDMTRGMLVTVLHRMEDEMEHAYQGTYYDVEEGHWATDAIHWASDHGIVGGYGNGQYGTHDNITREQMITMIYRYLNWMGVDTSARGALTEFSDGSQVSSWAMEAMQWGVGIGIINGVGNNMLDPDSHATRAQVAVFMQRVTDLMF